MPAYARKEIVEHDVVGVYHVYSRCVRQAFLCGFDEVLKKDYSHRKKWFDVRIKQLQQVFMIDMLGYSFLDNHFHNTLRIRPDLASKLSDYEVARRSLMVSPNKMPEEVELPEPSPEEIERVLKDREHLTKWRKRLSCISCYMQYLKEVISRRANAEDGVTGAFWEGRFKSVRLLDSVAVTICSLYVDLNEVRAKMALSPEASSFTSISARAKYWRQDQVQQGLNRSSSQRGSPGFGKPEPAPEWLAPIHERSDNRTGTLSMGEELPARNSKRPSHSGFLPMTLEQYLQLCDWTGRRARKRKRGKIPAELEPILDRLTKNLDAFLNAVDNFTTLFKRFCGSPHEIRQAGNRQSLKRLHGLPAAKRLYPTSN